MAPKSIQDLMDDFHAELGQEILHAVVRKFNPQKGFEGMFRILWDLEMAHKCVKVLLVDNKKSEKEATRLQRIGDEYLQENNLRKALELYNRSLMVAPHPLVDLAEGNEYSSLASEESLETGDSSCGVYETLHLSYRKRSAVLYELQHYDLCLRDSMLMADCPHHKDELEEIKIKCLSKLEIHNGNKSYETLDCFKGSEENISGIPKLFEVNSSMPCFSSACRMTHTPVKGRYIVASEIIHPGEILLVEKAFCTSINEERHSVQCSTCLRECLAPVPCPECTMAIFCSPSCRREGLSGAHRLECPILPTLYAMDMMPFFGQAYKLLSMASYTQWNDILLRLEDRASNCSPEDRGKNDRGIYSSDLEAVYNLCTNVEERSRVDLYGKCFIAFVLTKILQLSGRFFIDDQGLPVSPSEEDLIFTGQFLLANLMRSACNGFSITCAQNSGSEFKLGQVDIGGGIFPTLSLVNHSCCPSALPSFYGRYFVLRASRTLQIGDEITVGYCSGSYRYLIKERQKTLYECYQFECNCQACEEKWPTYLELPNKLHIKCTACSKPVDKDNPKCLNCFLDFTEEADDEKEKDCIRTWKDRLKAVENAKENLNKVITGLKTNQGDTTSYLTTICNAIEVLGKYLLPPSRILWDARNALQKYFHLEKQMTFH